MRTPSKVANQVGRCMPLIFQRGSIPQGHRLLALEPASDHVRISISIGGQNGHDADIVKGPRMTHNVRRSGYGLCVATTLTR